MDLEIIDCRGGMQVEVLAEVEIRPGRTTSIIVIGVYESQVTCNCHPHDPSCNHATRPAEFFPENYALAYEDGRRTPCRNDLIINIIPDGVICEYLGGYFD